MITTPDIFKGELHLVLSTKCNENTTLNWIIDQYEPIILQDILGQLYYELLTEIDNGIVDGSKWDLLLNGGVYEVDGVKYQFKGVKYLVACYIYFYYIRERQVETAKFGGKISEYENGTFVSLRYKAIRNWNNSFRLLGISKCSAKRSDTLIHFLYNNDFENWHVKPHGGGLITND